MNLHNLYLRYSIPIPVQHYRLMPVGLFISLLYSLVAPSHYSPLGDHSLYSRHPLTLPWNHDFQNHIIPILLVILRRHTWWTVIGPYYLFPGYYSVHPRKGRVVVSQFPHDLWASGCWHYERTLYLRRPFTGPEFLPIYHIVYSNYIVIINLVH